MPNKSSASLLPVIIVSLFAGIALAAAGFFGFQYYQLKQLTLIPPIVPPTPQSTTQPTPQTNPIPSDWKTYTDTTNGYSFKYPSNLKQTPYKDGTYSGIQVSSSNAGRSLTDGIMIKTLVLNSPSAQTKAQEQWKTDQNQPDFSINGEITPIKTIMLDGKTAYQYDVNFMGRVRVTLVDLDKNKVLRIAAYYADSNDQLSELQQLIDQILSTISFSSSPLQVEKQKGYIKSIKDENETRSITIDYVEMLNGDKAKQAMLADGKCKTLADCVLLNGYYLRNQNPQLRTFPLSANIKDFPEPASDKLFTIEFSNGIVTKITEQYLP